MNTQLKYFLFTLLVPLFISCSDELDEDTLSASLSPFHKVELNSVFDVYLIQDTTFAVKVVGNKSAVRKVKFSVEDDVLHIANEASEKWLNPEHNKIKLYIRSNLLSEVLPNETCYIETINPIISDEFHITMGHSPKLTQINLELYCRTFYYWNNFQCGGKVILRGKTESLVIDTFALVSLDASELTTAHGRIENSSKGDCKVRVTDKIEYSIRGTGNIYLYGHPGEIVLVDKSSSGELIELN